MLFVYISKLYVISIIIGLIFIKFSILNIYFIFLKNHIYQVDFCFICIDLYFILENYLF